MARSPRISQAFQGMILEKRAAGLSVHTIADYQNTLKKALIYFPSDPQIATITRDHLVHLSRGCAMITSPNRMVQPSVSRARLAPNRA